jgi:hypothetical protein
MAVAVVTRPLPELGTRAAPSGPGDLAAHLLGPLSLPVVGPDEDVKVAGSVRAHPARHHPACPGG